MDQSKSINFVVDTMYDGILAVLDLKNVHPIWEKIKKGSCTYICPF